MAETRSVSVYGDRDFLNALAVLAKQKNTRIGRLVRQALDDKYGDELRAISASFFASSDVSKHHLMHEENEQAS